MTSDAAGEHPAPVHADSAARPGWSDTKAICWLAVACGVLGISGGFGLFALIVHKARDHERFLVFLAGLVLTTIVAYVTETVKELIEQPGHTLGRKLSLGSLVSTLIIVAVFELFVMSLESLSHATDVYSAMSGTAPSTTTLPDNPADHDPATVKPVPALQTSRGYEQVLVVLLWLAIGITLTTTLSLRTRKLNAGLRESAITCLKDAAIVAFIAAPLLVLGLALVLRVGQGAWYIALHHQQWHDHLVASAESWQPAMRADGTSAGGWLYYVALYPMRMLVAIDTPLVGTWWGGWLVAVAALVMCVLAWKSKDPRLSLPITAACAWAFVFPWLNAALWKTPLVVMIAFAFPSLLLGAIVPVLRNPAKNSPLVATLALVVALVLGVATLARLSKPFESYGWMLLCLISMAILVRAAWIGQAQQFWPVIALCVALATGGLTHLVQYGTFLGALENLHQLSSDPMLLTPRSNRSSFPQTPLGRQFRGQDPADPSSFFHLDTKLGHANSPLGPSQFTTPPTIEPPVTEPPPPAAVKLVQTAPPADTSDEQDLQKLLELCLATSTAFWFTISILGSWKIVTNRATAHA